MKALLRRILQRLGLTGKLLLHVGWILAFSLGLLVGLAWWGAERTIRSELSKTQRIRVMDWAARHLEALEADDSWRIAAAVGGLESGPYVLYAGVYDKAGSPVARAGDAQAAERAHTLTLIHILRAEQIRAHAQSHQGEKPEPLAGTIRTPGEESPGETFRERFSAVLGDLGKRSEDLVGFVEITLDTAPLDRLTARVMGPVALLAALLFLLAMGGTLLLVRRVTLPLRMLREQADRLAAGETELRFQEIPRPLDEVGDLATHFSIMAARMARSLEGLEEDLRKREAEARAEAERLRRRVDELERR